MTSRTLTYDADVKALYIQLTDVGVLETREVAHEGNPLVDEDQARAGQIVDLPRHIHAGRLGLSAFFIVFAAYQN